ncbi:TPA: hypothetical protein P6M77_000060 [Pseudomonas aeruginosa]|uniref:hypothetical protein n=2 Tax=Pseudomonas aeruginosa TaxID=287 RepID=UPI000710C15A|nr:hypothetical protein [Pseudomonas aeruginosa]AYW61778.1 hypothetical protein EGV93_23460 [Pseudomonas aeruginosa]KSN34624.1 hypothetical protein APA78_01770 [Pseudomonas aeruginosa]PBW52099.1 hypothetical protein CJU07_33690 [Pseudomonas aeruginosa]QBC07346.1 hypothetical protein EWS90_12185 [Pseudomonas aeruginosa]UOC62107.1 hypothetical protein IPV49_22855 [Pseudomonas aeruginosa]
MARAWINNWKTTLSAGLSPGELSLTVPDAAAALLPLSGGSWVLLTLADAAGAQHEIVKATARAGGVVTIERAQESTADGNWPAGTAIYAAVTAGDLMALQARIQALESGASGGTLVDESGATLVDDAGNNLIMEHN